MTTIRSVLLGMLVVLFALLQPTVALAEPVPSLDFAAAAQRLRAGGYVLMMRHAQTVPGVGDPEHFRLDDCSTQRNLSDTGRQQARLIGRAFAEAGVVFRDVRSSQWCRCLETAQLAFGRVEPWSALNSTFRAREEQPDRARQIALYAAGLNPAHNVMLVTHQLTITPLVGGWVDSAEIVAFRFQDGRLAPHFRIAPTSWAR